MDVTAFPLAWPTGWPRTNSPTRARFSRKVHNGRYEQTQSVSVAVAMDRLQEELERLGARHITLSCNLERNLNGSPRSGQRDPDDCGVACYFRLDGKDTVLACDKWDRAADNMVAIAKHIEALRGIDRWGVGSLKQAFAGYQALPSPEQWWQVLGIDQRSSRAEIDAAYRQKAKSAHPDNGGSDAAMARLNIARDIGRSVAP